MPKTHIVEVGRKALDVIEDKAPQRQVVVEHLEADLGCISNPRELALRDKNLADCHSVAAADQLAGSVPQLEGVRVSLIMKGCIQTHDPRCNPGQARAPGPWFGASLDHLIERRVECHLER